MRIWILILLAATVTFAGCAHPRSWSYTPHNRLDAEPLINKSIAVVPFEEQRPDKNNNLLLLYLVPIVPVGPVDYERPEAADNHITSSTWKMKANEDIAKAVAQEIENARIARETFFTFRPSDGDLVLRGALERMTYDGGVISYGLSSCGPLLWFFLPAGYYSNGLRVSFRLIDPQDNKTLWSNAYENFQPTRAVWMYNMASDFNHDRLLKEIMAHAVNDLAAALGSKEPRVAETVDLVPLGDKPEDQEDEDDGWLDR